MNRFGRAGWYEHLSHRDLELLDRAASAAGARPEEMRRDEAVLAGVLSHPAAFESVFGGPQEEALLHASPFLTFAVIVHRGWAELQSAGYVDEWVGPRQRLPVLGGDDLREFLASGQRRLFLTELLTSYTRIASGTTWVQTTRGWRRRRFSELDPVRLASMLEVVPDFERPGIYRRLGDLALFLTGVFPDHTDVHGLGPVDRERLMRLSGLNVDAEDLPGGADISRGALGLLEHLGERWYQLASKTVPRPLTGSMSVVAEVAGRFAVARRSLNYLTDRHLFKTRGRWFGEAAS